MTTPDFESIVQYLTFYGDELWKALKKTSDYIKEHDIPNMVPFQINCMYDNHERVYKASLPARWENMKFEDIKKCSANRGIEPLEAEIQDILYSISTEKGQRLLNTDLCSDVAEEIIKAIKNSRE